ncbi:hypothetical protein Rs2_33284 [Raphanus sativus]|nr:hypothetical protein Rs2_33284 [Raphanus sativus]
MVLNPIIIAAFHQLIAAIFSTVIWCITKVAQLMSWCIIKVAQLVTKAINSIDFKVVFKKLMTLLFTNFALILILHVFPRQWKIKEALEKACGKVGGEIAYFYGSNHLGSFFKTLANARFSYAGLQTIVALSVVHTTCVFLCVLKTFLKSNLKL